jgi:crotonobetainyl-CoA:carnitine CoA-transferase CaiB-like acyl-CoA transferase
MARIVDLTGEAGAYGTRLLAEMGHTVVRVEPASGDAVRRLGPFLGGEPDLESGAFHRFWNAGKQSFTPHLGTEEGRRQLLELVRRSDALVASLPLPVDEAQLMEANPDLVLVRLDDGAPELCLYARSGLMAITGDPSSSPVLMGGHIPLSAVGTYLAIAASSALLVQQMTGRGQTVDVSAQQCLSALAEQATIEYQSAGEVLERRGGRGGITAVAGAIPCADGHWMLSAPPSASGWASFLELTQIPALMEDKTLSDEAARKEKKDYILDTVADWSTGFPADELVERAQKLHVPATPVTTPLHLTQDAQLIARGFLRETDDPAYGKLHVPAGALAALWSSSLAPAPRLGQHNEEILRALHAG